MGPLKVRVFSAPADANALQGKLEKLLAENANITVECFQKVCVQDKLFVTIFFRELPASGTTAIGRDADSQGRGN